MTNFKKIILPLLLLAFFSENMHAGISSRTEDIPVGLSSRRMDYGGDKSWIYRKGQATGTPTKGYIPFRLVTSEFTFDDDGQGAVRRVPLDTNGEQHVLDAVDLWNSYTEYQDPITGEEQGTRLQFEPFLSKIEDAKTGTGYQLAIDWYDGKTDAELQEIVDRHVGHFVRVSFGGFARSFGFSRTENYTLNGESVTYQVVQAGKSIRSSAHELLHVIGAAHEQARADRDKYMWLIDGQMSNNGISREVPRGCYDSESIMHYNRMQLFTMSTNAPSVLISRGDRMSVRAQTQPNRMIPFGGDNYYEVKNRYLKVDGNHQSSEKPNLLLNDGDWNGDLFKAFIDQAPTKGTVTGFNGLKGTFTYIPNEGTSGIDTFTYKISKINHSGFTSEAIKVTLRIDPLEFTATNPKSNLNPGETKEIAITVKNHSDNLNISFSEAKDFYTTTDSSQGGINYNWTDISSTGTILKTVSQSDRNKTEIIDLDWPFNFYGKSYAHIKVGAWGNIFFEKDYWHKLSNAMNRDEINLDFNAEYGNYIQRNPYVRGTLSERNGYYGWEGLPRRGEQVNDMAVLVAFGKMVNPVEAQLALDQTPYQRGQVYFTKEANKVIIQYTNMPEIDPEAITASNFILGEQPKGDGLYTYQVILHKNGEIEMQYNSMTDADTDPRYYIGLQDEKGENDFYVSREATFLPSSKFAIKLTQNPTAEIEKITLDSLEEKTFTVTAKMDSNAKPGDSAKINQLFSYSDGSNYGGGRIDANLDLNITNSELGLVITELFIDPEGSGFDTNKDGSFHSNKDEFVEIVNTSMQTISLDNYTLLDSNPSAVNYTFPSGTALKPGQSIVVIGDGYTASSYPELEDYVIIKNASETSESSIFLSLLNGGDEMNLIDPSGNIVDLFDYTNAGTSGSTNQSVVKIPEIGGDHIELHSAVYSQTTVIAEKSRASLGLSAAENKPFPSLVSMASTSVKALESVGKFDLVIDFEAGLFGDPSDIVVELSSGNSALLDNYSGDITISVKEATSTKLKIPYNIAEGGTPGAIETLVFSIKSASGRTLIRSKSATTVDIHYNGDGADGSSLIVTELLHDPNGMNKDHNRNGIFNEVNEDEYIEIVNAGPANVDISGFSIEDNFRVRHIFPQGTILGPYQAIVVFGDDNFDAAPFADFPEVIFQGVNESDRLGFNASSVDFGRLKDTSGNEISILDYRNKTVTTDDNRSMMRSPDIYGGNEDIVFHNKNTITRSSIGKTATGRSYPSLVSMQNQTIQVLESDGSFDIDVLFENGFFSKGSDIVVELNSGNENLLNNYTGPITLKATSYKDAILKHTYDIAGGQPLGTTQTLEFSISSATNAFIMPNSTLIVEVKYSDLLGIEDEFGVNNEKNHISLYPNPTTGIVNIVNHDKTSITNIKIYNILGKVIYETVHIEHTTTAIDLSHLKESGLLIIQISKENETSYHKILLKK